MQIGSTHESKRRVAIYIRVSTQEQKIDGYGLEAQKNKLLEYVNNNTALNLVTKKEWLFDDTSTGSNLNRPGFKSMMEQVKANKFDAVLVWKIDRLSRSLKHLLNVFEELKDNGVSFISVQENIDFKGPIGQLIFQVFGAIAQFERELIKGRTSMGKLASAEMGNYTGNSVPYGYDEVKNSNGKGKKLKIIEKEKARVEDIFNWYIYEGLGDGQIAKKLNELKVPKGKCSQFKHKYSPWTAKIINILITNSIYRGEYVANKKDEEGKMLPVENWTVVSIPSCVSEIIFNQAQQARKERTGGSKNTEYLLSGKIKDMEFMPPKAFTGAKRSKGGFSYRRKQFDKAGEHYSVFEIPGKQIEEYAWGKIKEALRKPELFIKTYLINQKSGGNKLNTLKTQLDTLKEREVNIGLAIGRIEDAFENGSYSEEKMDQKTLEKDKELRAVHDKISEIDKEISFIGSIDLEVNKLKNAAEQIQYKIDELNREQRKILCNLFIDRIEMRRKELPSAGKRKKWDIKAEIIFRFNPSKFGDSNMSGRTAEEDTQSKKGASVSKKGKIGVTEQIGTADLGVMNPAL